MRDISGRTGSLIALTDANGNVVEKYAYDPWGARRNSTDWRNKDSRTSFITNRGYTGHEHLDTFGIINMNGRVYDPLTAMFFSPDPFIQSTGDWKNYNRYSYCMNNPTRYIDPSGYRYRDQVEQPLDRPDYIGFTNHAGGGGLSANWGPITYNWYTEEYVHAFGTEASWGEAKKYGYRGSSRTTINNPVDLKAFFGHADAVTNKQLANIGNSAKSMVADIENGTTNAWNYLVGHNAEANEFFNKINATVVYLSLLEMVSSDVNSRIVSAISDSRVFLGNRELGILGSVISTSLDLNKMQNGEISIDRFYYRLAGTGSSITADILVSTYMGGRIGGAYGALGAFSLSITFMAGEKGHDMLKDAWYRWPDQFNYYINNTSNGYYNLNPNSTFRL